jgi:two-component system, OmpR family, response regulator
VGLGGQRTVLVADDDDGLRLLCRVNLELDGYRVLEAASREAVESVLAEEVVDVLLLDVHLGFDDGLALARDLRETRSGLRIAFLTGSVERPDGELADGFVAKPFTLEDLTETVRRLVSA